MVTSVVMESVTLEDIGDYKIHAKNPAGEDSCVAKLNVQGVKDSLHWLRSVSFGKNRF